MTTRKKEESSKQRCQANARERDRTQRNNYKTSALAMEKIVATLVPMECELQVHTIQEIRSSMCSVNTAFSTLRTLIPTEPANRKLSKIETLRLASSYISHLGAVLLAGAIDRPCSRLEDIRGACSIDESNNTALIRPQVCTFCLAIHKKYNVNVTTQVISEYQNHNIASYKFSYPQTDKFIT